VELLWGESIKIMKERISQQNYETWIKPIRFVSLEDSNVVLGVPNKFFKDWLVENYSNIIANSFSDASGIDVDIKFIVKKPEQSKVSNDKGTKTKVKSVPARLHSSLNPNYHFGRFVVGSSNQFAHAAALSVAEQPGNNYNPLFIYGGVGLGKTHLLNAIGIHTASLYPKKIVVYLSAEEFMNELIYSIRYDKMNKFREKYRKIDSLLMDDIQFIAGKERTQEEFFHTFNTLHDSRKQIVVTSDKFPKEIQHLEGRLRSRFEWGLIADIQAPDVETRIAIIEKKAQENSINLSSDIIHYIASVADSNVRELEGTLTRIAAYASLTGKEMTVDTVKDVVKNTLNHAVKREISIDEIIKAVGKKFNVRVGEIKSRKKTKDLVLSRQVVMYLSRKLTKRSFPDIGEKIGGRDHSTVIYSNNKIKKMMEKDYKIKRVIDEIEDFL